MGLGEWLLCLLGGSGGGGPPRGSVPPAGRGPARPGASRPPEGRGGSTPPVLNQTARAVGSAELLDGAKPAKPAESRPPESLVGAVLNHFAENRPDPTSFPATATRVVDVLEHPEVDHNRLIQVIGNDAAISAKVLSAANSTYFRRPVPAQTLRQAVTTLGHREVANLAVGIAGRALFEMEARAEYEVFERTWMHLFHMAMTTAFTAGGFAMERGLPGADQAFIAGMLHDIGKPTALRSLAALVVNGALVHRPPDHHVAAVLERVHVGVGISLARIWSLPEPLPTFLAKHHEPAIPADNEYVPLHVVRLVSGLNEVRVHGVPPTALVQQMVHSAKVLGVDKAWLRATRTRLNESAKRVSALFSVPDPGGKKLL